MTVHNFTSMSKHSPEHVSLSGLVHYFAAFVVVPLVMLMLAMKPAWADPPGRVGRIGESTGSVWLLQSDASDWIQALRNQPVTSQDRVATEGGSRAEINIGSTTLRLGEDTEVGLRQLDDARVTVDLARGSVSVRLRSKQAASEFTALTAEGKFVTLQQGYYRFDQIPPGSRATAFEGSLRFDASDSTLMVTAGQQAEFWRDGANVGSGAGYTNYTINQPAHDEFEQWSAMRDQQETRAQAPVYVSPEMTGAGDLAQYGQWSNSPEYGALWVPTAVGPDWAPYSTGHWDWVAPWGWTWVDDAAWGFAPFHYGRWVRDRDRWAWAPGTYAPRPVYAPALVAWVGGNAPDGRRGGPGPSVGWFPLAPREVYVPGYRTTPGYVRGINSGHAPSNQPMPVQNHQYRNRDVPGAMTIVATSVLTNREPVPRGSGRGNPGFGMPGAPGAVGSPGPREGGNAGGQAGRPAEFVNSPARPTAPVGAPPSNGPGSGAVPRFTVRDPRDVGRAYPGFEAGTRVSESPPGGIPQQGTRTGVPGPIAPAATPITPAVPQQPRVGERPESPQEPRNNGWRPGYGRPGGDNGVPVTPGVVQTPGFQQPRGNQPGYPQQGFPQQGNAPGRQQEFEQRRYQPQPIPRMERQQIPQQQMPQQVQPQMQVQPQPQQQIRQPQPMQQQMPMQQPQMQQPPRQGMAQPAPQQQAQPDGRNTFRGIREGR